MKDISDMTPEEFTEFNDLVKETLNIFRDNSKTSHPPTCFYFNGIRYDKDTPDELWDLIK